jgi:hypothetical protein
VLPHRLQHIRILVLDETIGDPSVTFKNPRLWKHGCNVIKRLSGLRILYFNVDTLYPKAWSAELEDKLLMFLKEIVVPEFHVIVRWKKPQTGLRLLRSSVEDTGISSHTYAYNLVRTDDYEFPNQLYAEYPAADMRTWIITKLMSLDTTC